MRLLSTIVDYNHRTVEGHQKDEAVPDHNFYHYKNVNKHSFFVLSLFDFIELHPTLVLAYYKHFRLIIERNTQSKILVIIKTSEY